MSTSASPTVFTQAVVSVVGTAVAPTTAIPDNCHTIIIYNRGDDDGLVGRAAPGAAALTEGTNATRIPAGASLTFAVGTAVVRGLMNQGAVAGSGLVYDAVAASATLPTFAISYLCDLRPGSPGL